MEKQKFKNEELTQRKCVNSILRFYDISTPAEVKEGLAWYKDANTYCRELASRFTITLQQAVGIIAAFSPQTRWTENKRYAVSFLINPKLLLRSRVQISKAKKILTLMSETDIYNAQTVADKAFKTKSFFLNILNPDIATDVTIDRHAIAVCIQHPDNVYALDTSYAQLTKGQYDFFQQCYMKAAAQLDILPHQLQATTWLTYRRLRELKDHSDSKQWKPFTQETPF